MTRTIIQPWSPGDPRPAPVTSDYETGEYCDHHNGFVEAGHTVPMEPRSRYRICDTCVAEVKAAQVAWNKLKADGLTELELRAEAGDR